MKEILPWLPATSLVLGLDQNLCRHSATRAQEKSQAMATAMHGKVPPRSWGPLNIVFTHQGQTINLEINCIVSLQDLNTTIIMSNQITFRENKTAILVLVEQVAANFYTSRKEEKIERAAITTCSSMVTIFDKLPESVTAVLPGRSLRELIEFPKDFDNAIGGLTILSINGQRLSLDVSHYAQVASKIHQSFQDSLPHL